jgi:hypothetical protein
VRPHEKRPSGEGRSQTTAKAIEGNGTRPIDHLELCFSADGSTQFYPQTDDPVRLARRLAEVVELLHDRPGLILCAAGWHPEPEEAA